MAVSVDKQGKNQAFAGKIGASFPVLSDPERVVARQYGVLNFFRLASRTTFVIDKEGMIRHIDQGSAAVDPGNAHQACTLMKASKP